jgi:hypothetical protein
MEKGFRAKEMRRESTINRRADIAKALAGGNFFKRIRNWMMTEARPTEKRRRISQRGRIGSIIICRKLINISVFG